MSETIEQINRQLKDHFGSYNDKPKYRVGFTDDLKEMRRGVYRDYLPEGLFLREVEEVREVEKYPWKKGFYVLEWLVDIPERNRHELVGTYSYEPLIFFEDKLGNPLPPKWILCKFVIEQQKENMRMGDTYKKYKDPEKSPEHAIELERQRLNDLYEALWGNETNVGDALAHHSGVTVPYDSKKVN